MGQGRSYTWNAWEGELAGQISGSVTDIGLVDMGGLAFLPGEAIGYLVIDPESPTLREYILWRDISGNTLVNCLRGLTGSANGGQEHLGGVKVRAVSMAQMFDDIWDEVVANTTGLASHIADAGDPHAAAAYTKEDYVDSGDLSTLTEANTYSDGLDHDHATPIGVHDTNEDAHGEEADDNPHNHSRYTDAEAVAAVGDPASGTYLPLAGGTLTGGLVISDNAADGLRFLDPDNPASSWWMGINDSDQFFIRSKSSPIFGFTDTQLLAQVPLAMGSNKITGLAAAGAGSDAMRYDQRYTDAAALAQALGNIDVDVLTDVTIGNASTTSATAATRTVAKPSGWGSYKFMARGFVQYGGADSGSTQINARFRVGTNEGTEVQSPNAGSSLKASASPVYESQTLTGNVSLEMRTRVTNGVSMVGKYASMDITLVRLS